MRWPHEAGASGFTVEHPGDPFEDPDPVPAGWRPDVERSLTVEEEPYEVDRDYVETEWGSRELPPAWGWGPFEQSTRGSPRRGGTFGRGASWGYDGESVVVRPGFDEEGPMPLAGEHRGPKGYRRSDERILEDVCEAMKEHPLLDCRDIEVAVEDGEVILSGTVSERRFKRLAEDVAADVPGVFDVINEIRIRRRTSPALE